MTETIRVVALAMLLVAVVTTASCTSARRPADSIVCGGVTAQAGGCDPGRHVYTGTTCADLAKEWGEAIDEKVVGVLASPPVVDQQGRGVRIKQAIVIASVDLNDRLRSLGLRATCDAPEVMKSAEPMFSTVLREGVGGAMYDGNPSTTYEEWRADLLKTIAVIDDEE
jgi:hypothetical protein